MGYARSDIYKEDDLQVVLGLVSKNVTLPNEYYALHLCNEWIVKNGVNKDSIPRDSTVGKLITLNSKGLWLPVKLRKILYQAAVKLRFRVR